MLAAQHVLPSLSARFTPPHSQVCEAQLQFAPRTPLPVFGGTYGPEVKKSILDIQESFQGLVRGLKGLTYDILDVKATRWASLSCSVIGWPI